jgi:carboxylesterase type B
VRATRSPGQTTGVEPRPDQFAKTGIPSVSGLIDWPAYTAEDDTYLSIGPKLEVKMGASRFKSHS